MKVYLATRRRDWTQIWSRRLDASELCFDKWSTSDEEKVAVAFREAFYNPHLDYAIDIRSDSDGASVFRTNVHGARARALGQRRGIMGRRGVLRRGSAIGIALTIAATLFVGTMPASAAESCPFSVIVNRSRNGNDGQLHGTIYGQDFHVRVVRGSRSMRLHILSEVDQYHQRVKAIPSKTSLRVFLGELEIDVVARRAGSEPQEREYDYAC